MNHRNNSYIQYENLCRLAIVNYTNPKNDDRLTYVIGRTAGCGTAAQLVNFGVKSSPVIVIKAPLFPIKSQQFGAENTVDYSHNYIIINRERRNSELYEEVFVSIRVYELLDEWFLLYNANDGEYYKCDQWDGLVRYLSDEVGIILN